MIQSEVVSIVIYILDAEVKRAVNDLKKLEALSDAEAAHIKADSILLRLIDDEEIREAFKSVQRWYS